MTADFREPSPPPAVGSPRLWSAATVALLVACVGFYTWRDVVLALPHVLAAKSDFSNYLQAARALIRGVSPFVLARYDYPPLLAFLVLPVSFLSPRGAHLAWYLCNHSALLVAAFLTWKRCGGDRIALVATAVVWAFCGTAAENLAVGQITPVLLLLLVAWWSAGSRSPGRSGVLLGIAAALKIWPGVLALVALSRRCWKEVASTVATAVLLVVAPLVAIVLFFPGPRSPTAAGYWAGTPALLNSSLPAVALRISEPPSPGAPLPDSWVRGNDPEAFSPSRSQRFLSLSVAIATLGIGILMLGWRIWRGALSARSAMLPGALLSVTLAASPIAWYHYQLILFPWYAFLFSLALRARRWGLLAAGLLLASVLTWNHTLGIGAYVERYGWTAAHPTWLWFVSSLVPVANLLLAWVFVRGGASAGTASRPCFN